MFEEQHFSSESAFELTDPSMRSVFLDSVGSWAAEMLLGPGACVLESVLVACAYGADWRLRLYVF